MVVFLFDIINKFHKPFKLSLLSSFIQSLNPLNVSLPISGVFELELDPGRLFGAALAALSPKRAAGLQVGQSGGWDRDGTIGTWDHWTLMGFIMAVYGFLMVFMG